MEFSDGLPTITVLLDADVPEGAQALQGWAAGFDFAPEGISVDTSGGLSFDVGGCTVDARIGHLPYPRELMDLREVGDSFDTGRAFLGLTLDEPHSAPGKTGMPLPDLWGPKGSMRKLSRLVTALLAHGRGVVLNRGGELVVAGPRFVTLLGDLSDPQCMPFTAWLDLAVTGEPREYATFGMGAFGLPEVRVAVEPGSRWSVSRAHEAVTLAAYRMVRERRSLTENETLRVAYGLRIGAYPLTSPWDPDGIDYRVSCREGQLILHPSADTPDVAAYWGEASAAGAGDPGRIASNAYQALLDEQIPELYPGDLVAALPCQDRSKPPHSIQVRNLADSFLIYTNGLGRFVQEGGLEVGTPHAELMALTEAHSFSLLTLIGELGSSFASREPGSNPWKVADTVAMALPQADLGGFVLADGGRVPMRGGSPVALLRLIPLTTGEYAQVRGGGAAAWLAREVAPSPGSQALRQRWNAILHAMRNPTV